MHQPVDGEEVFDDLGSDDGGLHSCWVRRENGAKCATSELLNN
jgi:hypothetical protein